VPRDEAVVMLAIDVSGSMTATDIAPTRLEAAIAQAKTFIANAPASYRIGLVAFDDSGHTLATPTTDRTTVVDALGRLQRGHGTGGAGDRGGDVHSGRRQRAGVGLRPDRHDHRSHHRATRARRGLRGRRDGGARRRPRRLDALEPPPRLRAFRGTGDTDLYR